MATRLLKNSTDSSLTGALALNEHSFSQPHAPQ